MLNPSQSALPQSPLKLSGGCNPKFKKHYFNHPIHKWLHKAMKVYMTNLIKVI